MKLEREAEFHLRLKIGHLGRIGEKTLHLSVDCEGLSVVRGYGEGIHRQKNPVRIGGKNG